MCRTNALSEVVGLVCYLDILKGSISTYLVFRIMLVRIGLKPVKTICSMLQNARSGIECPTAMARMKPLRGVWLPVKGGGMVLELGIGALWCSLAIFSLSFLANKLGFMVLPVLNSIQSF